MKKVSAVFIALLIAFTLSACNTDAGEEGVYGDPADYAGAWHSDADSRALLLYDDGSFSEYSVEVDEAPYNMKNGFFRIHDGIIRLSEKDGKDFVIWSQLEIINEEALLWGVEFNKISSEPDESLLLGLTEMTPPLAEYLGEWESDSSFMQITITEDEYLIYDHGSMSGGTIAKGRDYLLVGIDENKLTLTGEGGMTLEGAEGTFYPKGSESVSSAPHKAFVGSWYNETLDEIISFSDDGIFTMSISGIDKEGYPYISMEYSFVKVNGDAISFWTEESELRAWIKDGAMVVYEVHWLIDEDEYDEAGEYTEGVDYDLYLIDGVYKKQ